MYLQEILRKAFKELDWEDDLQIVTQNYGVNEFDVPSLKTQLLPNREIAKFYIELMVSKVECSFRQ